MPTHEQHRGNNQKAAYVHKTHGIVKSFRDRRFSAGSLNIHI
jgi:hypothetical protein